MESLWINVAPLPGALAVDVYDPTAHHGVSHVILLDRTTSLIMTWWYMWMHVGTQESIYRFGPLECVIPYFLLMLSIEYCWCSQVTDELWVVRDEFSYWSGVVVVAMRGLMSYEMAMWCDEMRCICRGTPSALYMWLDDFPFTNRATYLTLYESIFNAAGTPAYLEFGRL
jgi:hypothetical protein